MVMKKQLAIFGNIRMLRVYCSKCCGPTLVREGVKLCCNELVSESKITSVKVECEPQNHRLKPSLRKQREILEKQDNRCLYCNKPFGTPYYRNGKMLFTKLNFDHLVPFAYSKINKDNFVAACHICNGIKSSKVFDTVEETFHYIEYQRKKKGITYYEDLSNQ